jgi:hypothetical protein
VALSLALAVALVPMALAGPAAVNYANPFYRVITQSEQETAIGTPLGGAGNPGLAILSDGNLFVTQDPGGSLQGVFWELDYNAVSDTLSSATALFTEADVVAADNDTNDTGLALSGFAVSGETVYMLDDLGLGDEIIVVDLSGVSPALSGIPVSADAGFFDSALAVFPTLGTLVFGDSVIEEFAQYNVVTDTESVLISNATLAAGTSGTPSIDSQGGPIDIPGTTDFVWYDEDFSGGTGNVYRVDQAGNLDLPPLSVPAAMLGLGSMPPGGGAEPRSLAAQAKWPPVRVGDTPAHCEVDACCSRSATVRSRPLPRTRCRRSHGRGARRAVCR